MQQYRIAQYLSTFKILTSAKKETNQATKKNSNVHRFHASIIENINSIDRLVDTSV